MYPVVIVHLVVAKSCQSPLVHVLLRPWVQTADSLSLSEGGTCVVVASLCPWVQTADSSSLPEGGTASLLLIFVRECR